MKKLTTILLLCVAILLPSECLAKNYSNKAKRPTTSDHTWSGYDYNFNLDENGRLTGTNTFSVVYNTTPPRWYNTGYGLYMKICKTGHETLTITQLPGDRNYNYTLTTDVTIWDWDDHLLKWAKRHPLPYRGTRTFKVRNGIAEGAFEFPVATSNFSDVSTIYGTSENGVIPVGGHVGWKYYDPQKTNAVVRDCQINRIGDRILVTAAEYMEYLEHENTCRFVGKYKEGKTSTFAKLAFPTTDIKTLPLIASESGAGSALEKFFYIGIPNTYDDNYIDPYAPVEVILSNGHREVTTLQPSGSKEVVEYWTEDGYEYKHVKNGSNLIYGEKNVNGAKFVHVKHTDRSDEEKGFYSGNNYFMTEQIGDNDTLRIDWSPYRNSGIYIMENKGNKYYVNDNDSTLSFPNPNFRYTGSTIEKKKYDKKVFKIEWASGGTEVSVKNTDMLLPSAKRYIEQYYHPYNLAEFKKGYNTMFNTPVPNNFAPFPLEKVYYRADSTLVRVYASIPKNRIGESKSESNMLPAEKAALRYDKYIWELYKQGATPLDKLSKAINLDLDVPDYDVTKLNAKIIGKRTAELLKNLPNYIKKDKEINRSFGRRFREYKKVEITRVKKTGDEITIFISTFTKDGVPGDKTLTLKNNFPEECFTMWERVSAIIK